MCLHMCEEEVEEEEEQEEEKRREEKTTATGRMDNSNQAPLTNVLI